MRRNLLTASDGLRESLAVSSGAGRAIALSRSLRPCQRLTEPRRGVWGTGCFSEDRAIALSRSLRPCQRPTEPRREVLGRTLVDSYLSEVYFV